MKNKSLLHKVIAVVLLSIVCVCAASCMFVPVPQKEKGNGVSDYGKLSVQGTSLCAEDGTPVSLQGMSSHGFAWYPEYTNYAALKTLRDFGFNVFRVAMYSDQHDGYLEQPEWNEKLLYAAVENALAADMYVIVDWHVLRDENPKRHEDKAKEFFKSVARRYGKEPGVLFEICNEPNGETTYQDIVEYANAVIPLIREYAPDSVILVGTPDYCRRLEEPIENPLPYENIMYTYHYYSDSQYACKQIDNALKNGVPVFVSEWGYDVKSDTYENDIQDLDAFMNFLDTREISWVNWALTNKDEIYSFLPKDETKLSGWSVEELSRSGRYTVSRLHAN